MRIRQFLVSSGIAAVIMLEPSPATAQEPPPVAPAEASQAIDSELKALQDKVKGLEAEKAQLETTVDDQKKKLADAQNAAKEKAANAVKDAVNQLKYVELAFGVLPNSDEKVNNYAQVKANYTPALTSSFTYYSRNLGSTAEKEETTPVDGEGPVKELKTESEATISTEQTKLEINLIQYKASSWTLGGMAVTPSIIGGVDQIRDRRERYISSRQTFNDPKSNKERTIVSNSNIIEEQVGTLPHLDFALAGKGPRFRFSTGIGLLIGNRESVKWSEQGSAYFPGLTLDVNKPDEDGAGQLVESDDTRENKFVSNGIKAHLDLGWDGPSHGFGLHFQYLTKKGKRDSYSVKNEPVTEVVIDPATNKNVNEGKQQRIVETDKVDEQLTQTLIGVSWTMNFAKVIGVIPEARINMQTDKTTAKGGEDSDAEEAKHYDFGLIFNY